MAIGTFLGTGTDTYPQYLDLGAGGRTLVARPGMNYTIAIADQWQGLGFLPGDGLWTPTVQRSSTFSATPGLAIAGGAAPGEPGLIRAMAGPEREALAVATTGPAEGGPRVITGRRRKLRPPPRRRPAGRGRHRDRAASGR